MKDNLQDPSKLVLSKDLNNKAFLIFLKLLTSKVKSDAVMRLYAVFGRELLLFLSLFQAESVRVPALSVLKRFKEYSQIYEHLERGGFEPQVFSTCSKMYGRTRPDLENVLRRVSDSLKEVDARALNCEGSTRVVEDPEC